MAFHRFCRAAIDGDLVKVFGDGRQTRDFTFVGDVVEATRAAAEAPDVVGGIYNIGGGSQIRLNQALAAISDLAGRRLEVEYVECAHGDVRDTGAETARARQDLRFRPRVLVKDGLREEFEWLLGTRSTNDSQRVVT